MPSTAAATAWTAIARLGASARPTARPIPGGRWIGASYALSQVVVYNCAGQYGSREHTLRALLSTDGRSWTTIYTHNGTDFDVLPINAGNRTARYVRVQLAETNYLNLREVEVYGAAAVPPPPPPTTPPPPTPTPPSVTQGQTNLALHKPAT